MKEWREEISERLALPGEAAGVVKVSVCGSRRVLVENHRGVLEYTRERIEVAGGPLRLRISGDSLELAAMDREALLITGRVFSVEFE